MTNKERLELIWQRLDKLENKILTIEQDHYIMVNKFATPEGQSLQDYIKEEKEKINHEKKH